MSCCAWEVVVVADRLEHSSVPMSALPGHEVLNRGVLLFKVVMVTDRLVHRSTLNFALTMDIE